MVGNGFNCGDEGGGVDGDGSAVLVIDSVELRLGCCQDRALN